MMRISNHHHRKTGVEERVARTCRIFRNSFLIAKVAPLAPLVAYIVELIFIKGVGGARVGNTEGTASALSLSIAFAFVILHSP